uniref:Palmitoyltransferase n=1 Tax=Ditylum brightwellii TaxID=49249 RepID=A0A7S1ZGM5_9STRA
MTTIVQDTLIDEDTSQCDDNSSTNSGRAVLLTNPPPEDDLAPAPSSDDISESKNNQDGEGKKDENLTIEERYENGRNAAKLKHWHDSPYAVGFTEPTWEDELSRRGKNDEESSRGCCADDIDPTCGCMYVSGIVCSRLGAGRIGNMAVLKERSVLVEEEVEEDDVENGDGQTSKKTVRRVYKNQLEIVVGPFWPFMLFITYPLIFGVSGLTAVKAIPGKHPILIAVWAGCTFGLIYALFSVGCRDPGIMTRHRRPLHTSWRWNDQAQTYRPRGASYDQDCACVIEEFDHTCPWTGTGIGKKNMTAFQAFVGMILVCLIMDIMLLAGALG